MPYQEDKAYVLELNGKDLLFMTSIELVTFAARILDSKKAQEITAIKVRDLTIITDYFLIAGGTSTTQVKALADEIEVKLSEKGIEPLRTEGRNGAEWIVLDYNEVIIHIFYTETREVYKLERLWNDGVQVDLSEILKGGDNG